MTSWLGTGISKIFLYGVGGLVQNIFPHSKLYHLLCQAPIQPRLLERNEQDRLEARDRGHAPDDVTVCQYSSWSDHRWLQTTLFNSKLFTFGIFLNCAIIQRDSKCLLIDSIIEWFIKSLNFSRSYDLVPRPPPPPLCMTSVSWTGDTQEDWEI